jgi:hypothetical protein
VVAVDVVAVAYRGMAAEGPPSIQIATRGVQKLRQPLRFQ